MLALERMRERGQLLSGLYTPHDALYQRFGWERAEGKKSYTFEPKDVRLRFRSSGGQTEPATPTTGSGWTASTSEKTRERTARSCAARSGGGSRAQALGTRQDRGDDAVVWVDDEGRDQGYAVY